MAVDNINDIPSIEEVDDYVLNTLLPFMRFVLPDRKMIKAHMNTALPTTPYVLVRVLNFNGISNRDAIYHDIGSEAGDTRIYDHTITVSLKTCKGDARSDMFKLHQKIKNPKIHYDYFKKTGVIGVRTVTSPQDQPTFVDAQEWETGATMLITFSCLIKEVEEGFGAVEQVNYSLKISEGDSEIVDEGLVAVMATSQSLQAANDFYGLVNEEMPDPGSDYTWDNTWN